MVNREKTVFSNPYHVWAQGRIGHGRNTAKNRSFLDGIAYSYAEPVAKIVNVGGERIALIRDYTFSSSSARMQSEVRREVADLKTFLVAHVGSESAWQRDYAKTPRCTRSNPHGINHAANAAHYAAQLAAAAKRVATARTHVSARLAEVSRIVVSANDYAATFGLRARLTVPDMGAKSRVT